MNRSVLVVVTLGVVAALALPGVASAAPGSTSALAITPGEAVILAAGGNFPDALSGGILSAAYQAPILLTQRDAIPDSVAAEIRRRGTPVVIILGGETAVGPKVVTALRGMGITQVERVAGTNRYETSAAIALRAVTALAEAHDARLAEIQGVVDGALAGVQEQLDALAARVGLVETDVASLDGRIESLESSAGGDVFWPEVTITVDDIAVESAYTQTSTGEWGIRTTGVRVVYVYPGGVTVARYLGPTELGSVIVTRCEGYVDTDYRVDGSGTPPPAEGAPVEIEYWHEAYGQQVHGVQVITGWTYVVYP